MLKQSANRDKQKAKKEGREVWRCKHMRSCTKEVFFWIHRQTAQRMFPLSENESPLSGMFSQWPVPG